MPPKKCHKRLCLKLPSHGVSSGPNIEAFQTNKLSSFIGLALTPFFVHDLQIRFIFITSGGAVLTSFKSVISRRAACEG